jgi:hypothetical protein
MTMQEQKERNRPLFIIVRVFDVKSDTEERRRHYSFRKVDVDVQAYRSLKAAKEEEEKQQEALDKKWKSIKDLIIWGLHNGKSIELTNVIDEKE